MHEEFCPICPRDTVGTGGNTSDFLWYCSRHPTFLIHPSHPACKPQPPLITAAHCFFAFPMFCFVFFFNRQWPRKHLGATTSDRRWRMAFCCVSKYSACVRHLSWTSHLCSRLLPPGSGLWCKCCWYFPDGPPAGPLFVWRDGRSCFLQSL